MNDKIIVSVDALPEKSRAYLSEGRRYFAEHIEPAPYASEQAGNWREALVEAWPKLVIILTISGLALLMMSSISWSDVKDATKWPPFLWSIIFFLVASVFGKRKQNFRFLFFYAVGIITALWI